jgi:DNA-binding LacI/PurR family transcriptional regulator
MSGRKSEKILSLKAKLMARLTDGFHTPGQRFLSSRAVAARFGVSYQTAHRIIQELVTEDYLIRRSGSGTYIAGQLMRLKSVVLCFSPYARRPGSFGARLLKLFSDELKSHGITYRVCWFSNCDHLPDDCYPVIWTTPQLPAELSPAELGRRHRYALFLNNRPPHGLAASYIDSVSIDDFSTGVCAAQVLADKLPASNKLVVVSGPPDDERSRSRMAGFRSLFQRSDEVIAGGWGYEDGLRVAQQVLDLSPAAVFCVNDRLATALLFYCKKHHLHRPIVIGHDNAPYAEEWNLTSIDIPQDRMVLEAMPIIKSRLEGDTHPARQIILSHRPVYRLTHIPV